jgi:hypothetical protein
MTARRAGLEPVRRQQDRSAAASHAFLARSSTSPQPRSCMNDDSSSMPMHALARSTGAIFFKRAT